MLDDTGVNAVERVCGAGHHLAACGGSCLVAPVLGMFVAADVNRLVRRPLLGVLCQAESRNCQTLCFLCISELGALILTGGNNGLRTDSSANRGALAKLMKNHESRSGADDARLPISRRAWSTLLACVPYYRELADQRRSRHQRSRFGSRGQAVLARMDGSWGRQLVAAASVAAITPARRAARAVAANRPGLNGLYHQFGPVARC